MEDTESSDGKEPDYCTIPELKPNTNKNFDAVSGDSKIHYQELNTANGRSTPLYANTSNSDRHYENTLTQ